MGKKYILNGHFLKSVTIWPWLLAQAIVQLTLTDTKTRFRCIWFIQKVYWMVYKNGGDGGGDGGDAPLLVWWVWCYLVYWFPDLNLVKNSVGTLKPVQSKQTHSFGRVALCPSLDKAQELLWMVHTTPKMPVLQGSSGCVNNILSCSSELHFVVDSLGSGEWVIQVLTECLQRNNVLPPTDVGKLSICPLFWFSFHFMQMQKTRGAADVMEM